MKLKISVSGVLIACVCQNLFQTQNIDLRGVIGIARDRRQQGDLGSVTTITLMHFAVFKSGLECLISPMCLFTANCRCVCILKGATKHRSWVEQDFQASPVVERKC